MSTSPATTKPKITGMDCVAYLIKDVDRAKRFYGETIGLPVQTDFPQGAEYELNDGTTFCIWNMQDGSWHPSAGIMFHVDDVHSAVEYYRAQGVKITQEPFDTGSCLMADCEDSEGNSFILHARK